MPGQLRSSAVLVINFKSYSIFRFLREAGGYKNWAQGRGIFHNVAKTFLVWLNEEDHLRFISMEMGGNLGDVYCRLKEVHIICCFFTLTPPSLSIVNIPLTQLTQLKLL